MWAGRESGCALQMLGEAVDVWLGSAEVTSAPISASSAAELQKPKAQVPLSWHCSGEMPWLELEPGSKTPWENFPHGSEMKGESKTPQAGGCHKNLALGLKEAKQGDREYGKPKIALFCLPGQCFPPLRLGEGYVRVSLPQSTCENAVEAFI